MTSAPHTGPAPPPSALGPRLPEQLVAAVTAMPSPATSPQVEGLEDELAEVYGVDHAVAVASGTAALQSALVACGIGPGDEVLVPAVTVPPTIAAIVHAGARPVFVDATHDALTGGAWFDIADAAAKTTARTRAILPVHLAGRLGDLHGVLALADDLELAVIEDACQAQGSVLDGAPAGTLGRIGCFSLKDGKIITSGEGGYLLTDDPHVAAIARAFRTHWQTGTPTDPPGTRLGHNYRLAEPLAALARHSLTGHRKATARRRAQTDLLTGLVDVPGLTPVPAGPGEEPNGFAALWLISLPRPRAFAEHLASLGVVNSTGTFRLRSGADHPWVAGFDPAPCPRAAGLLDRLLAVPVLPTAADTDLTETAELISKEVSRWACS
jgi:perosamine synthetase